MEFYKKGNSDHMTSDITDIIVSFCAMHSIEKLLKAHLRLILSNSLKPKYIIYIVAYATHQSSGFRYLMCGSQFIERLK